MSWNRQFIIYAALIALSSCSWIFLSLSGLLDGLESEASRWRYLVRGEIASSDPVIFVDLDSRAVAKMGDKPWDRLNFAQTLHALLGPGNARAVGVDIIFSPIGAGSLLDVDRARKGDHRLGEVVQRYSDKLVLAAAYTGTNKDIEVLPLRRYGYLQSEDVPFPEAPTFPIIKFDSFRLGLVNVDVELNQGVIPSKVPAIVDVEGEGLSHHLINGQLRYFNAFLNQPKVVSKAGSLQIVDADGFSLDAYPQRSSHRLLTLGLEVFLAAHDLSAAAIEWEANSLLVRKDGTVFREIPLVHGQSMEVNWLQGWDVERRGAHYSMAEVQEAANALGDAAARGDANAVAEWEQWFEPFRDKVIFIGGVDATLKDLAPTPFNRSPVPKVGLHANTYRTVEEEAYIRAIDGTGAHAIVLILATLVAVLVLWSGRGRSFTRGAAVVVFLSYLAVVFYAFSRFGYLLPLIAPAGASISAALFVVLFKLGSEERQRRRLKNLFGAYVSPDLVDEMIESQRDPQLGGIEVRVTALFSDVEGFAELSEELTPSELVALMNEYLGAMTETFQKEQGTLDKYIGDAIVTMFGMPYPVQNHAARACRAAVRMQECHARLRDGWKREGHWPGKVLKMRTRIGINTGEAIIGNMGSEMRFNYTMMGDSVNLAARCESGAKTYGVYTMITADTLESALSFGEKLDYRKLDRVVVQGRSHAVEVYELWDGTVDPALVAPCRQVYEAALADYFSGEWESALAGFEACVVYEPARSYAQTTPSEVMAGRCREFLQKGTPDNWDGVYRMTSK